MSIRTAGPLVNLAHREGMEHAAKVVERLADQIMRKANQAHDDEDDRDHYDKYEQLEWEATLLSNVADKIRKAAKRPAALRDGGK